MTGRWPSKNQLLAQGEELMARFCELNNLLCPSVAQQPAEKWPFGACAYYRPQGIHICVPKCAGVGVAGAAWSYPGHIVDRTPYGVVAHELGHHVDVLSGRVVDRYRSDFSRELRRETAEPKLTNYCPDDGEWFAEIFRLFVTNPDLLRGLRPLTYAALVARGLKPVWTDDWRTRLDGAPERTIALCARRLAEAGAASVEVRHHG